MENTITEPKQSEICGKQIPTGAKPKTTIPLRVLDEEVWLSGSELKTDNSSSDEEKGYSKKSIAEDKIKRGARKKIKSISDSNITKSAKSKTAEKGTHQIEATEEIKEELSTCSEIFLWTQKYADDNEPINFADYDSYCNRADDEKSQLQKIKILEDRIRVAEKEYMASRKKTDKLVSDFVKNLEKVEEFKKPEWKYFMKTTKKWVEFFSNKGTAKNNQEQLNYFELPHFEKEIKKVRKGPARKISKNNFIPRIVKQLSRKKDDFALQRRSSLDILMEKIEGNSMESTYYEPYNFTQDELERISQIDNQLESFVSCTTLDNGDQDNDPAQHTEEINLSLTDSEKRKIYNLPTSRSLSSDGNIEDSNHSSGEEFDSCEDGFETSRNF